MNAIAETIKELGTVGRVELFVAFSPVLDSASFDAAIAQLETAGAIETEGDTIRWKA